MVEHRNFESWSLYLTNRVEYLKEEICWIQKPWHSSWTLPSKVIPQTLPCGLGLGSRLDQYDVKCQGAGSTGQEVFSDWVIKESNKTDDCVMDCSSVCYGQRVKQPILTWSNGQVLKWCVKNFHQRPWPWLQHIWQWLPLDGMYVHSSFLPDSCSGILRLGKYIQEFILTLVSRKSWISIYVTGCLLILIQIQLSCMR